MIWACAYYTDFYCPFTEEKYGKMVILSCFIFSNISWFTLPKQPVRLVWGQCVQKKIVYADILYFVEHVFSWIVACERGKPPEGAIASFYSTCYIKIRKHVFNKIQNVSIHNFFLYTLSKITTLQNWVIWLDI
jgi:hypothetical protein